jgi:hypothetical protein
MDGFMDANAAFDAIQKIAQSSKDLAELESMKARARAVIDRFMGDAKPQAIARPETKVLRQYLDGASATRRPDEVETPVFIEARDHLKRKATPKRG